MNDNGSKTLTFAEWVRECGGSGVIYYGECREIISSWKGKDWNHVDEYVAPIVHQLLVDAAEVHPRLYAKLMGVVVEAYNELVITLGPEPEDDKRPQLSIVK